MLVTNQWTGLSVNTLIVRAIPRCNFQTNKPTGVKRNKAGSDVPSSVGPQ